MCLFCSLRRKSTIIILVFVDWCVVLLSTVPPHINLYHFSIVDSDVLCCSSITQQLLSLQHCWQWQCGDVVFHHTSTSIFQYCLHWHGVAVPPHFHLLSFSIVTQMCGDAVSTTFQLLSFSIVTHMCGDAVSTTHQLLSFQYCYIDAWWCGFHHTSFIIFSVLLHRCVVMRFPPHIIYYLFSIVTSMCGDAVSTTHHLLSFQYCYIDVWWCGFHHTSFIIFSVLLHRCVVMRFPPHINYYPSVLLHRCVVMRFPPHINYYPSVLLHRCVVMLFPPHINYYPSVLLHRCVVMRFPPHINYYLFSIVTQMCGDAVSTTHQLLSFSIVTQMCGVAVSTTHQLLSFSMLHRCVVMRFPSHFQLLSYQYCSHWRVGLRFPLSFSVCWHWCVRVVLQSLFTHQLLSF